MSSLNNSSLEDHRNLKTPPGLPFPINMPGFPSPEGLPNMSMLPPNLLMAMQNNLPADKVREMLNEQADMLEQMVAKMKNSQVEKPKIEEPEIRQPRREEKRFEPEVRSSYHESRFERKDDFYSQRDSEMLRQELASVKLREESTYLELQKSHHQIHMLESQLLELQRKHFTELEHLNFENAEFRRKLEAAEYRNGSLLKENDYLKSQIAALKRRGEEREEWRDSQEKEEQPIYKERQTREYKEERQAREYKEERNQRKEVNEDVYKRDNRLSDKSPEEIRRKPVVKVEPIIDIDTKKKDYMPVRTIVNTSNSVTEALTWNTHKKPEKTNQVAENLQNKLNDLIADKERLDAEIERLSESRAAGAAKRKEGLGLELSICESNINSVTAKIRKMNWLSGS